MGTFILKLLQGAWSALCGLVKKPVFWLCLALAIAVVVCCAQHSRITQDKQTLTRYEENQASLLGKIQYFRTENGELTASVQALTLKSDELTELIPKYEQEIKQLRIDLRNAKSLAHVSTETSVDITAPLEPAIPPSAQRPDNDTSSTTQNPPFIPREFSWSDQWISIRGKVYQDTVICSFLSIDSLTLIAHYKKKRCLFSKGRKGKLIKYDVKTKNPHTNITDVEYIELIE